MRNSKILLQIFFLFVLISLLSFIIVNNFSLIQEKFGQNERFKALLVLLPTLPYLFTVILLLFGWRYQDIGFIIATFSLIFLYYVFEIDSDSNRLFIFAFSLFPINMLIASGSYKRKIFSPQGLFWLIILGLEIYFVILVFHFSQISLENNPPVLLLTLNHIANFLYSFTIKSLKMGNIKLPLCAMFTYGFSLVYLALQFAAKKSTLLLGYLLSVTIIFLILFIPHTNINITLFFIIAYGILFMAMIDSAFLLAYVDQLTGIAGRRKLDEDLKHIGKKTAIAMLDIDFFKKFNDKWGHKTGDQALKMVASRLTKIKGNPMVYRYGGEEFTVIFAGKNVHNAYEFMEDFRKNLENADFYIRDTDRKKHSEEDRGKIKKQKQKTHIKVSIGLAFYDKNLNTGEKLIKAADKALYKAKKRGRNRIELFNKDVKNAK